MLLCAFHCSPRRRCWLWCLNNNQSPAAETPALTPKVFNIVQYGAKGDGQTLGYRRYSRRRWMIAAPPVVASCASAAGQISDRPITLRSGITLQPRKARPCRPPTTPPTIAAAAGMLSPITGRNHD